METRQKNAPFQVVGIGFAIGLQQLDSPLPGLPGADVIPEPLVNEAAKEKALEVGVRSR